MTDVQQETEARASRKVRMGRVISDKMDKTVVVQVATRKSHPLYKKVLQRRVNFKAHDETNECRIGDLVRIMETRPLSKDKRWRVVSIVEKAR
jgi:small subunit ribosomal protein S17